jgi:peroxiredoxin
MRIISVACLTAAFFALLAPRTPADVKVGQAAPTWSGIPGVDGKKHALDEYQKARFLVLVFTCNHCPVAQAYQERLIALQKDYRKKGVQVVAVNVNHLPADRLDKMKERAKEKGYNFPYLYDSSQKIARDYGAKVTPHVFLLDQDRRIAYIGSVDDNLDAEKVKEHTLRDALDALLDGRRPPKTETKAFGCSIKYEKSEERGKSS